MKTAKKPKERGSVTIEATIALTAFMFAIITILTFLDICLIQAKVSYAINSTAKEISQYSYLYSLTGINSAKGELAKNGKAESEDISKMISDVNTIFNEVESLTGDDNANYSTGDTDQILKRSEDVFSKLETVKNAGEDISQTLEDIGGDPKKLMFGVAKLTASKGMDLAMSRAVAAPIARALCKKHLVSQKDGSVESFLKDMGVVPGPKGYYDGLDFKESTIFPEDTNVIRVKVAYSVKVIALLPVDWTFNFNQTAVTHGWMSGDASYVKDEDYLENHNIWTNNTIEDRSDFIRSREITIQRGYGYEQVMQLGDVQLYNPTTNEFIMIASSNPLYSEVGEDIKTLDDLSDEAIKIKLERWCDKMNSTTKDLKNVTTYVPNENGGNDKQPPYKVSGAKNKIILVIPQDEGLSERFQSVIDQTDTKGVKIELHTGYGCGARVTEVKGTEGGIPE